MGKSLTRKIIESHYVSGSMIPGEEVFLYIDQTLTHDINAVMTYLAFEAIGLDRVRTECSVSYLDHNLLYVDRQDAGRSHLPAVSGPPLRRICIKTGQRDLSCGSCGAFRRSW